MPSYHQTHSTSATADDDTSSGFKFHMIQGTQVYAKRRYRKSGSGDSSDEDANSHPSSPNTSLTSSSKRKRSYSGNSSSRPTGIPKPRKSKMSNAKEPVCSRTHDSSSPFVTKVRISQQCAPSLVHIIDDDQEFETVVPLEEEALADAPNFSPSWQTFSPCFFQQEPCNYYSTLYESDIEFGGLLERLTTSTTCEQQHPHVLYHSESLEDIENIIRGLTSRFSSGLANLVADSVSYSPCFPSVYEAQHFS